MADPVHKLVQYSARLEELHKDVKYLIELLEAANPKVAKAIAAEKAKALEAAVEPALAPEVPAEPPAETPVA